jgi:TRAP-type C4-dicarboxylate transport system permease small subunit
LAALFAVAGAAFALRRVPAMIALRRVLDGVVMSLVAAVLLAMVLLSAVQILLRNVLDTGLLWVDPLLRHFVLFLALLGGIVATGRKRHIQINVLERLLHGRTAHVVGAIVAAISAGICVAIAHASILLIRDEMSSAEKAVFGIPSWMILLAIPIGFFAIALRFAYLVPLELSGEAPQLEGDAEIEIPHAMHARPETRP